MWLYAPPPIALIALWSLWVGQALWCWYNAAKARQRVRRADYRAQRRTDRDAPPYAPPAALIVAIKGADERLARHVAALRRQDYPRYRIIFVVESEADPAYAALRRLCADDPRTSEPPAEAGPRSPGAAQAGAAASTCAPVETDLLVAGLVEDHAQRGGQKVHNLMHAVRSLRGTDEVVVFADADVAPRPDWMRRLIAPLRIQAVGAASGYRWLLPADPRRANLPTRIAAAINASVATLQGTAARNFAWGGSTAIRRRTLEQVGLLDHWRGSLSDDYQLTRAVSAAGKRIEFVPRLLVPTPVTFTWRSLLEFGRRQYVITRVHASGIWLVGLAATGMYTAAWISVLIAAAAGAAGTGWGVAALGIVALADCGRGAARDAMARDVLGQEHHAALRTSLDRYPLTGPLIMAAHLLIILASAASRRITWAGVRYHMRRRQDVIIEARRPPGGG